MARSHFILFFSSCFLGVVLTSLVAIREQRRQVAYQEVAYIADRLLVISETLWQDQKQLVQMVQQQDVQYQKLEAEVQRMAKLLFNCVTQMKLIKQTAGHNTILISKNKPLSEQV